MLRTQQFRAFLLPESHRGAHLVMVDMIVGNGNQKKDVKSHYLTASDADLVAAIDSMKFDK